ncbi:CHAT domain-containing protein [Dactylosporangium sp. NPDC005555]|uniref:CHAT domain-containing protein n=1 Tax=Dactylosporangium sp. NPDC005555 TaxID=3154889 RepID=UPI0033B0A1A0
MGIDPRAVPLHDPAGPVATGILIDDHHMLTCASAVAGRRLRAELAYGWVDMEAVRASAGDDLAVLRLLRPAGLPAAHFAPMAPASPLRVRIIDQVSHGLLMGVTIGPAWHRPDRAIVDLDHGRHAADQERSPLLGAPVVDPVTGEVLGVAVGLSGRTATIVPAQAVHRFWPVLRGRRDEALDRAAQDLAEMVAALVPMADQAVWDGLFTELGLPDRSVKALARAVGQSPVAVFTVARYVDGVDGSSAASRDVMAAVSALLALRSDLVPASVRPRDPVGERNLPPDGEGGAHHLVCDAPSAVRVGAHFSVVAQITAEAPAHGRPGAPLAAPAAGPVTILIGVDSGLVTLDETEFTVQVPERGDAPPVRFAVRAEAHGLLHVRVSAWAGGTPLATVTCQVSAEADPASARRRTQGAAIGSVLPRTGEVTLLVEPDGDRYAFRLMAPPSFYSSRVLGPSLVTDPGPALGATIETLRRIIMQEAGYTAGNAYRWVRETGVGLWQELVPDVIKDQFWQLRDEIGAFSIVCGDDRLPWELLYPLAPGHDEGFLVEQFPVLRQVADHRRAPVIRLGNARYVVPPNPPVHAGDEIARVDRLLTAAGVSTVPEPIPALDALLAVIDGGDAGLLHFACHNGFSVDGGGSSIKMDGGAFVPAMLNSARVERRLTDRHPLIFLNACHTARSAPYFTRMMGWAGQFMAAGAGAFVGTLWPVESRQAGLYAEAFYAALLADRDLGAASLEARRAIRDTADPSWLAYSTYGDPHAVGVTGPSDHH